MINFLIPHHTTETKNQKTKLQSFVRWKWEFLYKSSAFPVSYFLLPLCKVKVSLLFLLCRMLYILYTLPTLFKWRKVVLKSVDWYIFVCVCLCFSECLRLDILGYIKHRTSCESFIQQWWNSERELHDRLIGFYRLKCKNGQWQTFIARSCSSKKIVNMMTT